MRNKGAAIASVVTALIAGVVAAWTVAAQQPNPRQQPGATITMYAPEQQGTAEIDVNDLTNSGKVEARLKIPEGDLVLAIDKFNEFNPCQNGGIVGFLHEHGTDSWCGDNNWPKTFVYLAGIGLRARDLERQVALRQLRDALHGHARNPGPEDPSCELSDAEQEAAGRRGESCGAADRLLHPQPTAESEEQAEP
jgi:hypothetical protein